MKIHITLGGRHGYGQQTQNVPFNKITVRQFLVLTGVNVRKVQKITCYATPPSVIFAAGANTSPEIIDLDTEIIEIKGKPYIFVDRSTSSSKIRVTMRVGYLFVD